MTKPAHIWLTLTACGLIIVGAMGWLTQHILDLESERAQAVEDAELQHRVRLALSSMDTAVSGLLVIENQRPPYHFRAFYNPGDVFDTSFNNFDQSKVLQPSPLANDLPEFVKLHFELLPDGAVRSPQVPSVDDGVWGSILAPSQRVLESAGANLEELRTILKAPAEPMEQQVGLSNGRVLCMAVQVPLPDPPEAPGQVEKEDTGKKDRWVAEQVLNTSAEQRIQSRSYQAEFSKVERGKRKEVFEETLKKAARQSSNLALNEGYGRRRDAAFADDLDALGDTAVPSPASPSAAGGVSPGGESVESQFDQPQIAQEQGAQQFGNDLLEAKRGEGEVTPFRVLWVAGELLAVRRVSFDNEDRYQGIWFAADELRSHLLSSIGHLLPEASLVPLETADTLTSVASETALASLQEDPLALVTMPWRLQPGGTIQASSFGLTQIHLALGVGWVAVLFALIAAAALVRGVLRLSERRASFVSSVTHELRTPLTTFQLYSDLLAEGMVTDPEKKQSYLETLRQEAGRLNHLIENVLAYSRIERGAPKTRKEKLALAGLVDRLRPRLEERVQNGGMALKLEVEESCAERVVETDPGAVEQILFNLVDNACKYGNGNGEQGEVRVNISCRGNSVRMEVQDNGEGIARGDRRRLFRPFQKASRDEGDTKPGVGLGLSLCRRLARALGGDLRLAAVRKPGACFVLELPGR